MPFLYVEVTAALWREACFYSVLCYCKAMIGVAEWKHLGSDFGWESGRICANLTRPPAEGRERGKGEGEGGVEVETGGWAFK